VDDHETNTARDRNTYAVSSGYCYQVNPDWRFLADLDALVSSSDQVDFLDERYIKASFGYAYRLNVLARYTYLNDLPGADHVSENGPLGGAKQRSHVFRLDGIYEIDQNRELDGKLAYRVSEAAARDSNTFAKFVFVYKPQSHPVSGMRNPQPSTSRSRQKLNKLEKR
jgi:Putative MetA-pathway of phenol degradation